MEKERTYWDIRRLEILASGCSQQTQTCEGEATLHAFCVGAIWMVLLLVNLYVLYLSIQKKCNGKKDVLRIIAI
jgi:hypothetical protein